MFGKVREPKKSATWANPLAEDPKHTHSFSGGYQLNRTTVRLECGCGATKDVYDPAYDA